MSDKRGHNRLAFSTRTIHAGQYPDPTTGAVMVPIYATSTYAQESPGVHKGYEYSRSGNPTREAFERCIADLESGTEGFAFASGLAGEATVLDLLSSGDHVVCSDDVYGGTFRLFDRVRKASAGLKFDFVDVSEVANIERALTPQTRLVWVETPTNPLLQIIDIAAIAELAHKVKAPLAVDNTFASPYLQQPIRLGADLVSSKTGGKSYPLADPVNLPPGAILFSETGDWYAGKTVTWDGNKGEGGKLKGVFLTPDRDKSERIVFPGQVRLRLEFGERKEGEWPGFGKGYSLRARIYLAIDDPEHTVLGGTFEIRVQKPAK